MKTFKISLFFLFLFLSIHPFLNASSSFDELDEKIVDAFNSSPKKTADVYLYATQMIALANKHSSVNGYKWKEKAQNIITLAAYNEASKAYSKGDLKEALVWCERGVSSGSKQGRVSDYNVGDFYKMTVELQKNISSELKTENESYSKYQISHIAKNTSDITNPKKERTDEKRTSYTLVKGPVQDAQGNIYVVVNTPKNGDTKISFTKGKGWYPDDYGKNPQTYYKTWFDCAKTID